MQLETKTCLEDVRHAAELILQFRPRQDAYDIVDNHVVWDVVQKNLVMLHTQVASLLESDG